MCPVVLEVGAVRMTGSLGGHWKNCYQSNSSTKDINRRISAGCFVLKVLFTNVYNINLCGCCICFFSLVHVELQQ